MIDSELPNLLGIALCIMNLEVKGRLGPLLHRLASSEDVAPITVILASMTQQHNC